MYSHVYKFDEELEKCNNLLKKEKDVLDLSVLNPNNAINKAKIKMNIIMAFEMNTVVNCVNKCKSVDWLNGLAGILGWVGSGPNLQIR